MNVQPAAFPVAGAAPFLAGGTAAAAVAVAGVEADPAVSRHRLGIQLRQLRQSRGLRLADVADELGVVGSTLSRIETGKAPARASYVRVLLDLYGVADPQLRQQLAGLARQGQHDDWCAGAADLLPAGMLRYFGLETAAAEIRVFGAGVVPGLLQTPDYAAAAWRAARPGLSLQQAGRLAALTGHRQKALADSGQLLHAVIDEAALLRPVGSLQVLAAQIDHLGWAATAANVTVQVIPLAAPWPVLVPPFSVLAFAGPDDPDTACGTGIDGQGAVTSHPQTVRALSTAFTALARAALPPAQSAHLIHRLAREPSPAGTCDQQPPHRKEDDRP